MISPTTTGMPCVDLSTSTAFRLKVLSSSRNTGGERASSMMNLYMSGTGRESMYRRGDFLKLQIFLAYGPASTPRIVQAGIVKRFDPFTLSSVMLVRLHYPALNLKGNFVLKLYDRRFSTQCREQYNFPEWSPEQDAKYRRFALSNEAAEFFKLLEENESAAWDRSEEWDDSQKEAWVEFQVQKMYHAESETYRRLANVQGVHVPRLIARVALAEPDLPNVPLERVSSDLMRVRGLLLQYVPGSTLQQLYSEDAPPIPRCMLQYICDDAVRAVNIIGKCSNLNKDSSVRNSLVCWDPIALKYKVFIIDFGQCDFRQPGESDRDWRCRQSEVDEEGAIGYVMERFVKEKFGWAFLYKRTKYREQLDDDFLGEDGPII